MGGVTSELRQVHWQFKDGRTEFVAQREISSNEEMSDFVKDCWRDHPPPQGAVFMVCTERSPHFVSSAFSMSKESADKGVL